MLETKRTTPAHTPEGEAFTELILETFRLNGRLLAAGDRLIDDLGLTSARWQVLGAIEDGALPVAQIARNMGLARQSVQRTADILAGDGVVEFSHNPDHRRAKLVGLSPKGQALMREVQVRQKAWANRIAAVVAVDDLACAVRAVRALREQLEGKDQ